MKVQLHSAAVSDAACTRGDNSFQDLCKKKKEKKSRLLLELANPQLMSSELQEEKKIKTIYIEIIISS